MLRLGASSYRGSYRTYERTTSVCFRLRWAPQNQQRRLAHTGPTPRLVLPRLPQLAEGFDSTSKVPLIKLEPRGAVELAKLVFPGSPLIETAANLGNHRYACLFQLANVDELASTVLFDAKRIVKIVNHPMFWVHAWLWSVPYGRAKLISEIPLELTPETNIEVLLMGLRRKHFSDPIFATEFRRATLAHEFQLPLTWDEHLLLATEAETVLHSFLAKTLWGHALTGSVLHNLLLHERKLYALWLGAGQGFPFLAGHFNNVVACSEWIGTWPRLAKNLEEAFKMRLFWEQMEKMQGTHSVVTPSDLELMSSTLFAARARSSRYVNNLGIVHTSLGAPVRASSYSVGGLLELYAALRGEAHSRIKH